MAIVKPEIGELNWGNTLNAALDALDQAVEQANSNATEALGSASTAVSTAQAALTAAGQAETNAKAYADAQDDLIESRIDDLENNDWDKTITLPDSSTMYRRVNIPNDATDPNTWPDRLAFYFNGTRTGYFNERGELRARPSAANTVALRVMGHASGSTSDIFQVSPSNTTLPPFFRVTNSLAESLVPFSVTQYLTINGHNVYVSDTDPGSVPDGSVWIDTSGA